MAVAANATTDVSCMAREILFRIACQFPRAISSERWGIMTVESAFVMVNGMKSKGITIPDTMPNSDTAWLLVMPLAIKRWGIRIVLMELMKVIMSLVKVMGTAMATMLLIKGKTDGFLVLPFDALTE